MKFKVFIILFAISVTVVAQERGLLKKPKTNTPEKQAKDKNFNKPVREDDEFSFEEAPTLRFANEFMKKTNPDSTEKIKIIPIKEENTLINENTSTIDESESQIVEIEPYMKVEGSDELVRGPSYFAVWDTKRKNPYNLDATEFDEVVPLKLYDISEGRLWKKPIEKGIVNSEFKWRGRRWHEGVDLDVEIGDPVYAPFDGIVRVTGRDGRGYGNYMILRHYNGIETIHAHLSKINFETNTLVKAGDIIGLAGNTGRSSGPHLHFEMLYEGNPFNPRHIYEFLPDDIKIIAQEFIVTSRIFDYLRGKATLPTETNNLVESEENYEGEAPVEEVTNVVWVKVKSGDSLTEIAQRNGLSIQELCKLNHISPRAVLKVGKRLRIQ